ncbi:MAG: aminotransferase class I/II-fold pyridoxal phosphate-dependent enzyme [Acidobacteriota bacterium]
MRLSHAPRAAGPAAGAAVLESRLRDLEPPGLRRRLRAADGIDLSSNDYLGFARDPILSGRVAAAARGLPVGSTGSRLLRGEIEIYERVETALARFVGREEAVLFPSGYQANVGLLSALLRPGDLVCTDELNHASIIDGIRLSRARKIIYPHRDAAALRRLLAGRGGAARGRLTLIVTESLFSADGDIAPLEDLAALARELDALLIVDEAHATGLFGTGGGGLVQALGLAGRVFATVHTGGKALGAGGAWVAGAPPLKDYLVNFSRPFIFSTAPVPALAAALGESIAYWERVGAARARQVLERAAHLRRLLRPLARELDPPRAFAADAARGPIIPFVLGDNRRAVETARRLQRRGFDARALRPPTVPDGTARLRLTVTWPVERAALERFAEALGAALRSAGP